jgi:hypothetical protein
MRWTINQVYEWAKGTAELLHRHADILRQQYVTGSELLTLTEEKLLKEPYKMPGGPATRLALAVLRLKILPGNYNLIFILTI